MRNMFNLKRKILIVFAIALAVILAIGFAQNASAVSLKHNSMIETNVITLGDVFAGLDHKSDKVLGPAPRPGHDMTLNARTLMRIAVAMDLPWRPQSAADQVVLSRAATVVGTSMIEDKLEDELRAQGLSGTFELAIVSGVNEIVLPYDEDENVAIESLSFDGDKNRFNAIIVAPSKDNAIVREKISGKIERMSKVPVLRNAIRNGSVISENDLDFITMPTRSLQHGMALSANELIGYTPRRLVLPGKPVKMNDIQAPQIVKRGELITMTFDHGGLSLTAQGKALESGAKGDVIRVVNANTSKTLQAKITANKEVSVQSY